MVRRAFSAPVWCLVLCVMSAGASICNATIPVLLSAVSRMNHGATPYDVLLPLSGGSGIECRTLASGLTIVATFDQAVVSGAATANAPTGAPVAGTPTFSGSTMIIPLTSLTNFQTITITVSLVKNAANDTMVSATIPLRTLTGNVQGSGTITGGDVNVVRAAVASGAGVNGGNFRCDINAVGALTGSDVNIVRLQAALGSTVAGGATSDTAPTFVTTVPNQTAVSGSPSTPAGFTVASTTAAMTDVFVVASTSDPATVPVSSISITGVTGSRSLTITPPAGLAANATVTITLTVTDGLVSSISSFSVVVSPPPTTYLATLTPVSGTNSFGSGSATLVVSGDQTFATLTYSYHNLSGADSDDAIYAPGNDVLFDISAAHSSLQANGSYLWTFKTSVTNSIPFQLQTIANNQAYIAIESSAFPNGELMGVFQLVTGSQSFTPPGAPPAITINPPTAADASRFYQQAAFGGTASEISNLSNAGFSNASTAINDWLTNQYNSQLPIYPSYGTVATVVPSNSGTVTVGANTVGFVTPYTFSPSSMYAQIYLRTTQAQAPNAYGDTLGDDRIHESWYKNVIAGYGNNVVTVGADQLRQRIATAYGEIFVISQIDDTIDGSTMGNALYHDMLANDAFANFRTILGDVTLNPCMGEYLNMAGNGKTNPNENYAREIMQLFTIGLYMLQPDGTLMLDVNGQPIPTYSQSTITEFAKVYTGWNYGASVNCPTLNAPNPPTFPTVYVQNVGSSLCVPMIVSPANGNNHNTASKTLLSYPGVVSGGIIAANSSQNTGTVTAELNFALDNIFNHPNVGPFFCKRLIQRLVESNPSPAYVYRVAQVFNNDGTGTRGNMRAVITAILTDYEARSPAVLSLPGYGHQREPIIRMANIIRSLNGKSLTGKWFIGKTDTALTQTIFRSPTVFNFFDPAYQQPGPIQQAGLVSPEFDIIYETTIINAQNMIYTGVYSTYNASGQPTSGTGFRGDNESNDVYIDFSTATGSGLLSLAQTSGVNALVTQVGLLLMGPPMDSTVQANIVAFINNNFTPTDYINQVKAAVYLVATSSQCSVQK